MAKRRKEDRLGLDFGKVIGNATLDQARLGSMGEFIQVRPVPLALRCIGQMTSRRFRGAAWIVSKCRRRRVRLNVKAWLEYSERLKQLGIPIDHIEFCDRNWQKAEIARRLRLTHFVDDSLEVLIHMPFVPHRFLFRPDPEEVAEFGPIPGEIVVIPRGWRNLRAAISET